MQVMALVVAGLLSKQGGGELDISEITVKAHRDQVMQKMKAKFASRISTHGRHAQAWTSGNPLGITAAPCGNPVILSACPKALFMNFGTSPGRGRRDVTEKNAIRTEIYSFCAQARDSSAKNGPLSKLRTVQERRALPDHKSGDRHPSHERTISRASVGRS